MDLPQHLTTRREAIRRQRRNEIMREIALAAFAAAAVAVLLAMVMK